MERLYDFILNFVFKGKAPSKQEIKKIVLEISDIFTFSEQYRPLNYLKDEALIKGYLLYFVPVNLSKIYSIFRELYRHPALLNKREIKIVDIGCGPSPAILPLLSLIDHMGLKLKHVRYVGVEQEGKAIEIAEKLINFFKPSNFSIKYDFIKSDASDLKSYLEIKEIKPDLMIFSNSLGELFDKASIDRETFINFIKPFTYKNPEFTLMIIEPGTKKSSMRLHELRDALISELDFYPYSPCLDNLPCSAFKVRNWCYEERRWTAPSYLTFLSSVGLQVNYLKFSYVVFRKDGINIKETFGLEGEIIKNTSHLLNEKGKSRLWACWKGDLVDIEKLKRDFSEDEQWLKIKKGAYFLIDKYLKLSDKKVRIPKDCEIKILYSP
ncbi:small ribosomal subunit Rsm22 family protein [Thermodesulfovibrio hydrogeniphilus]